MTRRPRRTWIGGFVGLVLVFGGYARSAEGQVACVESRSVGVAPALYRDGAGDRAFGLRIASHVCRIAHDTRPRFARSSYLSAGLRAALPFRELRIPQNVEAGIEGGLSVSLSERRPLELDDDPDAEFYRFNLGYGGVAARLQYEAASDFSEQALVGGADLRWVDPTKPFLPSVVVSGVLVRLVASELREGLGLDRETHGRLGVQGYWLVALPARLALELDLSHFWAFGMQEPLEASGWDRGPYAAVGLGYGLERTFGPLAMRSVFLGFAHGQRPTGPSDREAWTVGLELGPAR